MRPISLIIALPALIAALPSPDGSVDICHSVILGDFNSIVSRSLSVSREGRAGVGPWPKGEIHVFFPDAKSRTKLLPTLQSALKIWSSSSPKLSHLTIAVDETQTRTSMVTSLNSNNRQSTTIGFDFNGGMRMDFDPTATVGTGDPVTNMVHELGHALGLFHEHQRPDAAQFVKFNCEALKDFDDVKKAAKKNGDPIEELCEDDRLASDPRYNFSSAQYIPFGKTTTKDFTGAFDFDSIMIYGSFYGAKNPLIGKKPKVLTKLNGDEIIPGTKPSKGDIERVVKLYEK